MLAGKSKVQTIILINPAQATRKKSLNFSWFRRKTNGQEQNQISVAQTIITSTNTAKPLGKAENLQLLPPRKFDWYFEPKAFEKDGKIYEKLGINSYKKLVKKINKISPAFAIYHCGPTNSLDGIKKVESETRKLEAINITFTVIYGGLAFTTFLLFADTYTFISASALSLVSIQCSLSTLLNRYNRARIYGILEKKQEKGTDETKQ